MSFCDYFMPGLPKHLGDQPDMGLVRFIRDSISGDNGQTMRSSMLLPCPFCGHGEPSIQTHRWGDYTEEARVVCPCCHVATSHELQSWPVVHTPTGEDVTRLLAIGKAISSWNRRAE